MGHELRVETSENGVSGDRGEEVGDRAVLWGEELSIEEVARKAGTIPYTLMCGVTARVNRQYRGARG